MADLFKLVGTITINNAEANAAIDETIGKADEAKSAISGIRETAVTVGKAFTGVATILGGAFVSSVENTREYREQMNMLNTAFTSSGHSAEAAHKTYSKLHGVLGDSGQATEAANHLAKLTNNTRELQTWTDICTGVFATFGESLPLEGLTEAANETAKVGQVVGPLADALNWMGISEDAFNESLKGKANEQERQQLIMETLNDLYKDASDLYKENNADIIAAYEAQDKMTAAIANFGAVGEPILTTMKESLAGIIDGAFQWIVNNGEAVGVALGVIAIGLAAGAVAAHPYAAAILVVAGALASLVSAGQGLSTGANYDKMFDKFSDEELQTLQAYVDAVNAAREAEQAYIDSGFGEAEGQKLDSANAKVQETHDKAKEIEDLIATYNAWRSGQAENQGQDLYLDVPIRVSEESEKEMQSEVSAYDLEGLATLFADPASKAKLQSFLDSLDLSAVVRLIPDDSALDDPDGSHAGGLDRVPFNGYHALLHKDEMVLTAAEAAVYRRQKGEYDSTASRMKNTKASNDQPINVTLNINGNTSNPYELAGEVRNALELLRWQE